MKMKPYYVCEICGNAYKNVKSAELCEKTHLKGIYEKSEYGCGNTVPTSIVVSFEGDEFYYDLRNDYIPSKFAKVNAEILDTITTLEEENEN